jgi:hypothetical protein
MRRGVGPSAVHFEAQGVVARDVIFRTADIATITGADVGSGHGTSQRLVFAP